MTDKTQEIENIIKQRREEMEQQLDAEREALEHQALVEDLQAQLHQYLAQLFKLTTEYETSKNLLENAISSIKARIKELGVVEEKTAKKRMNKEEMAKLQESVLNELLAITANGEAVSCSELALSLHQDQKPVYFALKTLVSLGKAKTIGQKRGTMYLPL